MKNTLNTWLDVDHAFEAWSEQLASRLQEPGACRRGTGRRQEAKGLAADAHNTSDGSGRTHCGRSPRCLKLRKSSQERANETYSDRHIDGPSAADRRHFDRASRRMCKGGRSRRLCRSQWRRCRRTTRGSSAHEVGRSTRHNRHGRARQHRDQSNGARVCLRKRPAGMPLPPVKKTCT
jgi:hypothetical protein